MNMLSIGQTCRLQLNFNISNLLTGFCKWLYEKFKWPFVPIYGGFPVKFCTYLGDPIPYDPNITAAELADKVTYLSYWA